MQLQPLPRPPMLHSYPERRPWARFWPLRRRLGRSQRPFASPHRPRRPLPPPTHSRLCSEMLEAVCRSAQAHFQLRFGHPPRSDLVVPHRPLGGAAAETLSRRPSPPIPQLPPPVTRKLLQPSDPLGALADLTLAPQWPLQLESAFNAQTRSSHRAALRCFSNLAKDPQFAHLPIPVALAIYYDSEATTRAWAKSTLARKVGTAIGALQALDFYSLSHRDLHLTESSLARAWSRTATHESRQTEGVVDPPALLREHFVKMIMDSALPTPSRVYVLLAFLTAARPADLLPLTRQDVKLADTTLSITFRSGKCVKQTGPFTIFADVDRTHVDLLHDYIKAMPPSQILIPDSALEHVRRSVKTLVGGATLRAFRRGSLQAMSSAGLPLSTILLFSRHRNLSTLSRYLGWGAMVTHEKEVALQASRLQQFGKATAGVMSRTPQLLSTTNVMVQ